MPIYHTLGTIPRKRHTVFRRPDGGLYSEELMGHEGFIGTSSLLYHTHAPTTVKSARRVKTVTWEKDEDTSLRHRHFLTARAKKGGSPTMDRVSANEWATDYGYNLKKWVDYDAYKANPSAGSTNLILIRYADVLLMYAEAKIELNEIDQSVYDAINAVRQRPSVEMPPITTGKSQTELRALVRNERAVELAFEGLRLFDMNRWQIGEEKAGIVEGMYYKDAATNEWKVWTQGFQRMFRPDRDYVWPIPQAEVEINDKITQNDNY